MSSQPPPPPATAVGPTARPPEDKDQLAAIKDFQDSDKKALSKETDQVAMYKELQDKLANYKGSNLGRAEFQWRLARTAFLYALTLELRKGDSELMKKLVFEARDHAQGAVESNSGSADAEQWFAITLGKVLANYTSGNKEKVAIAVQFKEHVDKALAIRPNDPILRYINGRWLYEVASLSWFEKKMAAILFKKLPEATFDQAIEELRRVHNSGHRAKTVYFFLAKSYGAKKDYKEAIKWLDIGLQTQGLGDLEDEFYQPELERLRTKYAKRL